VEERTNDLAELVVPVIWQNCLSFCLSVDSVPVIWQNCLYVEEHASDLAELPNPVIWQNCLYVDSVPVNCQNCLYLCGQCASDLAELFAVPVIWQNCLSMDSVPVIWQNCLYVEERASDLAELVVPVILQNWLCL